MAVEDRWVESAILYEIYVRSFFDSNNDGNGDLQGIIDKLDYLSGSANSLGINAIWLTPFYASPMADGGYDVSDYQAINPLFGSLETFKKLLKSCHERQIKVVIDFVPNHTSDQHDWFQASLAPDSPKHDWYVWKEPRADGSAPNNWRSVAGGSAWQYHDQTKQYYLHSFLAEQPDLNWDNPQVREAMKQQLRYWLDMGVDGLRIDSAEWLSKDPELRDDPPDDAYTGPVQSYHALSHTSSKRGPHLFDYLRELSVIVASYPERFMLTEVHPHLWNDRSFYRKFYEEVNPDVSAPFNVEAIFSNWQANTYQTFIDSFQTSLGPNCLPIYCLGSHDQPRLASRLGRDKARTTAILQLTLPGMPVIYYGDELGISNGAIGNDQAVDKFSARSHDQKEGRDPERTPMAWSNQLNAGFSQAQPWLPLSSDYQTYNVQTELNDQQSFLELYRRFIKIRHQSKALRFGSYHSTSVHPEVLFYERQYNDEKLFIALNFSNTTLELNLPVTFSQVLATNYPDLPQSSPRSLALRPYEGLILQ